MSNLKKDIKDAEARLEALGFQFQRESAHRIWRHPDGRVVVTPKPHGSADPHAVKNMRALIKRLERGQQ